ncbi:MAG: hypothetical protein R3319_03345, partial [Candidatus Bathyarchaeia archaeon]|nr:hypothetical protein [Candidatus Bathyarchaeia archaeon]
MLVQQGHLRVTGYAKADIEFFRERRQGACLMTKALFMVDSYLNESPATVVSIKDGKYVRLDQTIFYPRGGGQPHDTGKIIKDN